jgi:hypothetical protein
LLMRGWNKKSGAAWLTAPKCAWLHSGYKPLDLLEYVRLQLIVNPPSVLTVSHNSGIFENAKMEGEARLRGIEGIGELADAPLSFPKQLNDLESGLVWQRMKELDRALGAEVDRRSHGFNISTNLGVSMPDLRSYAPLGVARGPSETAV